MRNMIFSILILFIFYGCEETINILGVNFEWVEIWLQLEADENGYYHIEYDGTTYHHIYFLTEPNERVYWDSPDSFVFEWNGIEYEQAIVNYSTYADNYGNGQQSFYLDNTQIGDTLMIFGYVDIEAWDYLYFILEDNE